MTNFYSSFGDDANKDKEVPKEIIEELNKDIPHNLEYIQNNEGDLIIVPRKDHISEEIRLSTQIDLETEKDEELKKRLVSVRPIIVCINFGVQSQFGQ